ncbi:MAG TPA: hypothetical protein VMN60_09340 [Longimicrobiales bacterium]|nr:hypothetical protein [Longimicrobiales bacterium]
MLFKRKQEASESVELVMRVAHLQVEALQCTLPGEASIPLNHAGDLLLRTGDLVGALDMYGRAADNLVEADRFEAATGICRKIIRIAPAVVRARCTLTWLAIGAGFTAEVGRRVEDYIGAAATAGREAIAAQQVKRMSAIVDVEALRLMLGEQLLYLGDARGADALFGEIFADRDRGIARLIDAEQRWRDVRRATLQGARLAA